MIEENLAKIKDARYGKDVRDAIHDAIHDCYEDGKAGATDLVARERITAIASLPSGSTRGDAELIDARITYEGVVYNSLGECTRKMQEEAVENRHEVSQKINEISDISKNLFFMTVEESRVVGGITTYVDDDGYVCLDGKALNTVKYALMGAPDTSKTVNLAAGTYRYTIKLISGDVSSHPSLRYLDDDGTPIAFSTTMETVLERDSVVNFRVNEGTIFNNAKYQIMLERGTEATPYTKHGTHTAMDEVCRSFISSDDFARVDFEEKDVEFILGNITQSTFSPDRISIKSVRLPKGYVVKAKDGYQCGAYDYSGGDPTDTKNRKAISSGWNAEFTINANLAPEHEHIVVFKTEDGRDFTDIYKSLTISDVIESDDYTPFVHMAKKLEKDINVSANQINDFDDSVKKIVEEVSRQKSKWKGKRVAFIGDSITAGVNTDKTYHEFLNDMIGFENKYVDAIAGSCYSSKSDYGTSKTPIVNRVPQIPADRDLIVIFAGSNDFGHGTPLGTIDDTTDVSFYGAVTKSIMYVVSNNPSTRLVVMTPLHRAAGRYLGEYDLNAQGKVLKDYIYALREVCEKYSIPIIDTYSISGINPNIPSVYSAYVTDGVHPNTDGHKLIAERIFSIIEML